MAEQRNEQQQPIPPPLAANQPPAHHHQQQEQHFRLNNNNNNNQNDEGNADAAVISGSDVTANKDEDDDGTSCEENSVDCSAERQQQQELYSEGMDEEDEAWVYRFLRCGLEEEETIVFPRKERRTVKVLKPRNSDAILSCPCCFQTVCMDCQRHEHYENQFRAMFVMNIAVDWDKVLVFEHGALRLLSPAHSPMALADTEGPPLRNSGVNQVPLEYDETYRSKEEENSEFYYSVHCANCTTEVAALNMEDEVYHFYDCLASG